jgi:hypothetical protein
MTAAPSIAMMMGVNIGGGECSQCKTYLALEIEGGVDGERMTSMPHSEFVAALESGEREFPAAA